MTAILVHTDRPTANRSSGRRTRTRWYRVVTAQKAGGQTLIESFNLEVASGGYFGWGEQSAIGCLRQRAATGDIL
jgi:hypothetical protein